MRVLYGARTSLLVAFIATTISMTIGVTVGVIAGYYRGFADTVVSRISDVVLALPVLLLAIGIAAACGADARQAASAGSSSPVSALVIFVISAFTWPYIARIVRSTTLSLREKEFVEAARSLGASNRRIILREILPNLVAPITIWATLLIPSNILFEAALSFLGLGVPIDTPSWGQALSDAAGGGLYRDAPWLMIFPGHLPGAHDARVQSARRRPARRARSRGANADDRQLSSRGASTSKRHVREGTGPPPAPIKEERPVRLKRRIVAAVCWLVAVAGLTDRRHDRERAGPTARSTATAKRHKAAAGGVYRVEWESSFDFTGGFDPTGEYLGEAFGIYSNLLVRTLVGYNHVAGAPGNVVVPDLATEPRQGLERRQDLHVQAQGRRQVRPAAEPRRSPRRTSCTRSSASAPKSVGAQYGFYYNEIKGMTAFTAGKSKVIRASRRPT